MMRRQHVVYRSTIALVLVVLLLPWRVSAARDQQASAENLELQQNYTKDAPYLTGGWAGIRRALLGIFGFVVDSNQLDADRKDQALVRQYYQKKEEQEDLEFLQKVAPAAVYLPLTLRTQSPAPGQTAETAAQQNPCNRITDLHEFLTDCAAISQQRGVGRVAMLREGMHDLAARLASADTALFIGGQGVQPEYEREQENGMGTGTTRTGAVDIPVGKVHLNAQAVPQAEFTEHAIEFGTTNDVVKGTDTNTGTSSEARERGELCITGPDGKKRCLGPVTDHGIAGHAGAREGGGCTTCGSARGGLPGGSRNVVGGLERFFGGGLPGRAQSFFGSRLPLYQSLLGPERFFSLAQGMFGRAGGSAPPRPTLGTTEQLAPCDPQRAHLNQEDAIALAQALGMDPTAGLWTPSYQPTATAFGTEAFNAEKNEPVTLQASHFRSEDQCLWVIAGPARNGLREVVLLSDTEDPAGTEYHLIVRDPSA